MLEVSANAVRDVVKILPYGKVPGRHMKIHEYQAKALLRQLGVPVPKSKVVLSAAEARNAAIEPPAARPATDVVVVKAQIHAGGRGKGQGTVGGVKVAKDARRAEAAARNVRHAARHAADRPRGQEGPAPARRAGPDIDHELYLGMLLDRATGRITVMASHRRRHGHRGGRRDAPRRRSSRVRSIPPIGLQAFQARSSPTGSASRAQVGQRARASSCAASDARLRSTSTARCSRSTRSSSTEGRQGRSRSTPRSTSTTTPCSATPSIEELRDLDRGGPGRARAKQVRPQLHQRSTATSAASSTAPAWRWHDGHHQVPRRRAGQLPRRRRRRHGRDRSPRRSGSS